MSKRVIKIISLILIPVFITSTALTFYSDYLDKQLDSLYNPALGRTYGIDEMNKGIKLLQHNAKKDDLIILGSSELDSNVPQNPQNMFPNNQLKCDVDLVGRACVQDLLDSIKVGALKQSFKDRKIVLVVSLQWFLGDDIDVDGFKAHFSELQFYRFINDSSISHDKKVYSCTRIIKLLKNDSKFEREYLYALLYQKDSIFSNMMLSCLKPYYYFREKFLDLKDKHQAYKAVEKFKDSPSQNAVNINWDQEEIKAKEMGEKACTNNDFYVDDEYYSMHLKSRIDSVKNSYDINLNLLESKEFGDYKLLLEVFKEAGIRPYIVFMSTNGFYYDYIGITKKTRLNFYDKLGEMADEYGFDYLDLRDKEYEPYFYRDVMHLGWKGWLYVNKQITEYYS